MKKTDNEEVVYSINIQDIQDVANDVLERNLTKKELEIIKDKVGDYIDWFQAIENAINNNIHEK